MKEDLLKKAMREMGSRGGKRRLETMTQEQRSELARKAAVKSSEVRSRKAAVKKKAGKKSRKGD